MKMVPNMACIIDLTAAKCYYNFGVFADANIQYEKISCANHEIPDGAAVEK
jgi:hypothetical protein